MKNFNKILIIVISIILALIFIGAIANKEEGATSEATFKYSEEDKVDKVYESMIYKENITYKIINLAKYMISSNKDLSELSNYLNKIFKYKDQSDDIIANHRFIASSV